MVSVVHPSADSTTSPVPAGRGVQTDAGACYCCAEYSTRVYSTNYMGCMIQTTACCCSLEEVHRFARTRATLSYCTPGLPRLWRASCGGRERPPLPLAPPRRGPQRTRSSQTSSVTSIPTDRSKELELQMVRHSVGIRIKISSPVSLALPPVFVASLSHCLGSLYVHLSALDLT